MAAAGFEQFVGSKTAIRILNSPDAIFPKDGEEATLTTLRTNDHVSLCLLLPPCSVHPAADLLRFLLCLQLQSWSKMMEKHHMGAGQAYMADPEFLCHTWDWVQRTGDKPSSGLVGVVMAIRLCQKVGPSPADLEAHQDCRGCREVWPGKGVTLAGLGSGNECTRISETPVMHFVIRRAGAGSSATDATPMHRQQVNLYGFQSSNYFGRFTRPHYYDWERPKKGREKVHPFAREVWLYQQLDKFGYIKIHG